MSLFKLYNYFEDNNYVYLVLEMCHNGEMSRYLKERKMPFSEDEGQEELFYLDDEMKHELCCSKWFEFCELPAFK